jgi:hypothetical protein
MIAEVLLNENLGEWLAKLRASKSQFSDVENKLNEFFALPLEDRVELLFAMIIGVAGETFNHDKELALAHDVITDLATEIYGDDDEETDELLEEAH